MSLISKIKNGDIVGLYSQEIPENEINEQDEHGNTALHYAMASGNWYMIKYLLDHNASMRIENKEGISALQIAKPDSIRRICVEKKMRDKSISLESANVSDDKIVNEMGFSSNTIRLKHGIERHSEIITNKLKNTKERLSKILSNTCNYPGCCNYANCIFQNCKHIVFCMEHAKLFQKCPKCRKEINDEFLEIVPIT